MERQPSMEQRHLLYERHSVEYRPREPSHRTMPQALSVPAVRASVPETPASELQTRKKNMMDEDARRQKLEDDEWTTSVTAKSVKCKACGRTVSLDKRSRYYPGLWVKHRGKCMEVKRLEALRKVEVTSYIHRIVRAEH